MKVFGLKSGFCVDKEIINDLKCDYVFIDGYMRRCLGKYVPIIIVQIVCHYYQNFYQISNKRFEIQNELIGDSDTDLVNVMFNGEKHYFFIMSNKDVITKRIQKDGNFTINRLNVNDIDVISQGWGHNHCFIYTKDHKLYGYGRNQVKQLSLKHQSKIYSKPTLVTNAFISPLIQIQCGWLHSIFLCKNGDLFGCGYNNYGQICSNTDVMLSKIIPINDIQNIVQIGCGTYTSYFLNNKGILYSVGSNTDGLLGINDINIKWTHKIQRITNISIKQFSVGMHHVGLINNNNELYMFGNNKYGQCGLGILSTNVAYKPTKVKLNDVINIKCGGHHNICTNKHGYHSFGYNEYKQCLLNKSKLIVSSPNMIHLKYIQNKLNCQGNIITIIPSYMDSFIIQKQKIH